MQISPSRLVCYSFSVGAQRCKEGKMDFYPQKQKGQNRDSLLRGENLTWNPNLTLEIEVKTIFFVFPIW